MFRNGKKHQEFEEVEGSMEQIGAEMSLKK